jgi:hypothetical protein
MLFLTKDGHPFGIKARTPDDPRPACPVLGALVRRILVQAGLTTMTTNAARRHLAQRLVFAGATFAQVGEVLGIVHPRSVSRLTRQAASGKPRPNAGLSGGIGR